MTNAIGRCDHPGSTPWAQCKRKYLHKGKVEVGDGAGEREGLAEAEVGVIQP